MPSRGVVYFDTIALPKWYLTNPFPPSDPDIVLERIVTGAEVAEAVCLEGERSCPPEDVGGPSGYMDYLEALRDPSHPDHREMVEWRESSFNPERFDLASIHRRLHQLSRSRRRTDIDVSK